MIDFRCDQCGKLLRAPLDAVGKQSRCPACSHVQLIPAPTTSAPASASSLPPLPPQPGANPFAQGASTPAPTYDPNNPYAAPAYDPRVQAFALPGGPIVPTRISVTEVLNQAGRIFSANIGPCIGIGLVVLFAAAVIYGLVIGGVLAVMGIGANNGDPTALVGIVVALLIGLFVASIAGVWIFMGVLSYFLKLARGQVVSVGEIFSGGRFLLNGILAQLLVSLVSGGIAMLTIAPFSMLAVAAGSDSASGMALQTVGTLLNYVLSTVVGIVVWYVFPLVVDRGAGPMEALRGSFELTRINIVPLILLFLVMGVVFFAGAIACGLGLIVAMPYLLMLWVVSYLHASGQPTAAALYR